MLSAIKSLIAVPVARPGVPAERPAPPRYEGRHRAPEPTVEIGRPVGEVTVDRRPYDLAQWEGETRRLTPTPDDSRRIQAAAGVL